MDPSFFSSFSCVFHFIFLFCSLHSFLKSFTVLFLSSKISHALLSSQFFNLAFLPILGFCSLLFPVSHAPIINSKFHLVSFGLISPLGYICISPPLFLSYINIFLFPYLQPSFYLLCLTITAFLSLLSFSFI